MQKKIKSVVLLIENCSIVIFFDYSTVNDDSLNHENVCMITSLAEQNPLGLKTLDKTGHIHMK